MSLRLYYHPLSSYCQKVLVALYELGTPFEPLLVDLGNETARNDFYRLWPVGSFPVLGDSARDRLIPESSIIIEYLDTFYPGPKKLIPSAAEANWQTRFHDRFFDWHVHDHMQKIVGNKLRPEDAKDPFGTAQRRAKLRTSYAILNDHLAGKTWVMGDDFTLADCSAAPALFYAELVEPFGPEHTHLASYQARLKQRPSFARVIEEAKPFFRFFPGGG